MAHGLHHRISRPAAHPSTDVLPATIPLPRRSQLRTIGASKAMHDPDHAALRQARARDDLGASLLERHDAGL